MKKVLWVMTCCFCALSMVFAAQLVVVGAENDKNKRDLENVYKSTVVSLGDSLDNLEVNMSKLMVARGAGENRRLITDTYRHAETAAAEVAALPLSFENITAVTRFFNQVGDWCMSFIRAIDNGSDTTNYRAQADEIYAAASHLSQQFRIIEENIEENGAFASIGENRILPYDFESIFTDFSDNSVEYPALIYDGPFSDGKRYSFAEIDDKPEITRDEALEIAFNKFGITADNVYLTDDKTAAFAIEGRADGQEAFLMPTKKGGFPLMMSITRSGVSGSEKSRDQLERDAENYMERAGMKDLKAVWFNRVDDYVAVNLAPVKEGVVFYTDLVKVRLSAGGEIEGFECSGYCAGSVKTGLTPSITAEQAKAVVSDKIAISCVRLAVIPVDEKQVFCYEVAGSYKGLDYFVYVDAVSGKEVNILRVVDNKQGSMTM